MTGRENASKCEALVSKRCTARSASERSHSALGLLTHKRLAISLARSQGLGLMGGSADMVN
jgi:hypothetical protein